LKRVWKSGITWKCRRPPIKVSNITWGYIAKCGNTLNMNGGG